VSEHTIKAHLSTVFSVLGAKSRTEAVYKAAKLGVKLF
ncbi:MAG: DNA-binding NarL/FixJ family response regulator, partial [Flavobacterium sp.]